MGGGTRPHPGPTEAGDRAAPGAGEPIEYSDDRYRPDLVSFAIENSQQAQPALARNWTLLERSAS